MEKYEKDYVYPSGDYEKITRLADNYVSRLRTFQDSLLGWMVTWNISFLAGASS